MVRYDYEEGWCKYQLSGTPPMLGRETRTCIIVATLLRDLTGEDDMR